MADETPVLDDALVAAALRAGMVAARSGGHMGGFGGHGGGDHYGGYR